MGIFSMISITYQLGKNQVILIVYDQSRRPKAKTYIKKIRPLAEGISKSYKKIHFILYLLSIQAINNFQ